MNVTCVCDACNRSIPVKRVWISKHGKVVLYLECGHVSGFVFDAKILKLNLHPGGSL